jgi:hypothetical protein
VAAVARCHRNKPSAAGLVAVAAAIHFALAAAAANEPAGGEPGAIGVQGRWAYSRQAGPDDVIDMATTPAAQDPDVWLLLACSGQGRLSVALMHSDYFPFELDGSSSVQVQSARLSEIAMAVERAQPAQIAIDPALARHIMPLLINEQDLSVSVTARDGIVRRYTFALQPNDVALAPLRSRCSGD